MSPRTWVLLQLPALRRLLKATLPAKVVARIRRFRRGRSERAYFRQRLTMIHVGSFDLEVPAAHLLVQAAHDQPQRDECVAVAAEHLSRKYPSRLMVDIGANVGDTAALIASRASNPLLLLEASEYFFSLLQRNAGRFPNPTKLERVLVAGDASHVHGSFRHWGGTASFDEDASIASAAIPSRPLSQLADDSTCFVKIDTDGFDFRIVLGSLDWIARVKPALLLEDTIRSRSDFECATRVFDELAARGYDGFIVWDDPGFHVLSTRDLAVLSDLHGYLLRQWQLNVRKSICNYDVLCVHADDEDIFMSVSAQFRQH